MAGSHRVLGKTVETPVEIREAHAFMAVFSVPTVPTQSLIDYAGLEVLQYRPGRGLCILVFVDYIDGDLGPYNEFGVCFLVRNHRSTAASVPRDLKALIRGRAAAFIHQLPVDDPFSLAAGRSIWGFPKIIAEFDAAHSGRHKRSSVSQDGKLIAELSVKPGLPVSCSGGTSLETYSHLGGVTRHTPWEMNPSGVRTRIGGAELKLGTHSIAEELKALGLPRRALLTSSIANLRMTFGDAQP